MAKKKVTKQDEADKMIEEVVEEEAAKRPELDPSIPESKQRWMR